MISFDLEDALINGGPTCTDEEPGLKMRASFANRDGVRQRQSIRRSTFAGAIRDGVRQRQTIRRSAFAGVLLEAAPPDILDEVQEMGFGGTLGIAFLSCFMGATDGLSLGGLVFPANAAHPNTEFKTLGMSLGLLTLLITNLCLGLGSKFRFAVGGAVIPQVAVVADVFHKKMGPTEAETILVAVGLVSLITGVLIFISGCGLPVQEVLNYCPFVVYGGFLAGTGVLLLNFGFNLLVPDFTSILDIGPSGLQLLFSAEAGRLVVIPTLGAIVAFLIDRLGLAPRCIANFVLPASLLIVFIGFFLCLLYSGMSLEEARSAGWLFEAEIPNEIDFYKVWTSRDFSKVNWDLLFSTAFLLGILKSYLIGLLTITQGIFGTMKETGENANVDHELRLHGVTGVVSGALGALPGCMVMSFACTARRLGVSASGNTFPAALAFFSLLFFMIGGYIIAIVPKMLPGLVLLWLGIEFCVYWLYDLIGKVPLYEHLVVVLMTVVDVEMDSGSMIIVGLFASFLLTVRSMASQPPCTKVKSLGSDAEMTGLGERPTMVRSDVRRLIGFELTVLQKFGKETLVLTPRDLFFTTCAQLSQRLAPLMEAQDDQSPGPVRCIILDVAGQASGGVHFMSTMAEFAKLSQRGGSVLILAGIESEVLEDLESFGINLEECSAEQCGQQYFVASVQPGTIYYVPALTPLLDTDATPVVLPLISALELAEELTILRHRGAKPAPECGWDPEALFPLSMGDFFYSLYVRVNKEMADVGVLRDHPSHALMQAIHLTLLSTGHNYSSEATLRFVERFALRDFEPGSYVFQDPAAVPPLIMLVEGELEQSYLASAAERNSPPNYLTPPHPARIEKMRVRPCDSAYHKLVGPARTTKSFRSRTPHKYAVRATQRSRCALLYRDTLDAVMCEDPEVATMVMSWLGQCERLLDMEASWQQSALEGAWHASLHSSAQETIKKVDSLKSPLPQDQKAEAAAYKIVQALDLMPCWPPSVMAWLKTSDYETIIETLVSDAADDFGLKQESVEQKERIRKVLANGEFCAKLEAQLAAAP